jgi:hypothetical protein
MAIKLNGSTSGSIQLNVPAAVTGGDVSLSVPGAGTLDRLERVGNILQVIQVVKTDRASVTGYNWADTGLSVNITPTSTASNILVLANVHLGSSNGYDKKLKLVRDSTDIGLGDGNGGRPAVTSVVNSFDVDQPEYNVMPTVISYLDTGVSTTSQVTYKVQFAAYSTFVAYINRTSSFGLDGANTPAQFDSTPISTLTLMEVAG